MTEHDRKAGTSPSHAAAERPRCSLNGEHRPRRGRTWFGSWVGQLAGARYGLRNVLPGLLSLLLLVGISPQAEAQVNMVTVTPAGICEGQTTEVVVSNVASGSTYGAPSKVILKGIVSADNTEWSYGTNFTAVNADGDPIAGDVAFDGSRELPITVTSDSFTLRIRVDANVVATSSEVELDMAYLSEGWTGPRIQILDSSHANCAAATTDGVSVSESTLYLTELHATDAEKTYTVVLDTDPTADVTITATTLSHTAMEFSAGGGAFGGTATLTFTAGGNGSGSGSGNGNWAVPQTVTVRAVNDGDASNASPVITHTASAASGPYNGITISSVTVHANDAGHGVTVSEMTRSVHAGDDTATYTVRLKSQPGDNVVISTMSGATATATVSPATLTFTASGATAWNVPQTVMVTGKGAGTATISHSVSSSGDTTNYPTTMSIPSVTVTVTADTSQVLDLSFNDTDVHEGSNTRLRVTATGASGTIAVTGGTSLLDFSGEGITSTDYSVVAATNFVFSPPNHRREVVFTAQGDSTDEPNETLTAGLQSLPSGYRAGTTASILLIDQNPTTVTLVGTGTVMEDGSNSRDVLVTLGRNLVANETVTVPLVISGDNITSGDYMIELKTGANLNSGVTLSTTAPHSAAEPALVFAGHATNTVQEARLEVTAVQDTTDEGNSETLTVSFGTGTRAVSSNLDRASGTGTSGTTTAGTATVTITDDDGTPVNVTWEITDGFMTLKDVNDTASVRYELDRALVAGETLVLNVGGHWGPKNSSPVWRVAMDGSPAGVMLTANGDLTFSGPGAVRSVTVFHTSALTNKHGSDSGGVRGFGFNGPTRVSTVPGVFFKKIGSFLPQTLYINYPAAGAPTVTASASSASIVEGGSFEVTFTLSEARSEATEVIFNVFRYVVATGTGLRRQYDTLGSLYEIDIPANSLSVTFTVTYPDDNHVGKVQVNNNGALAESGESFEVVRIGELPDGVRLGLQLNASIAVYDNDDPANPVVTIAPGTSSVTEGTAATFTVTATPAPTSALSVSVTVSEDESSGQDFVASSNETMHTVSIPASGDPNAGMGTLSIATVGDSTDELDGAVTATVDTGSGYTVGNPSSATVTITDDDDPATTDAVSVSGSPLTLTELHATDAEKTYTVVLDTDPTADVTITVANGDATAVEVDTNAGTTALDSTLTFTAGGDGSGTGTGNGNWAVPQTVTVRALNDGDAANESFNITHSASAASGPYATISVDPVAITTTDAGHGVTVSEMTRSVAENDDTATYTIRLKSQPSGNVVISTMSDMTARAEVAPATLTFTASGATAWNVPQTVTVIGKGQGTATISHAVQSSADTTNYPTSMSIPSVAVTVTADPRPVLDLSFVNTHNNEGVPNILRVTATGASSTFVVAGGTSLLTFSGEGVTNSDYSVVAASNFSFASPNYRADVSIDIADDSADEPNETVTVGLQNLPSGYRAGTTASFVMVDQDPTSVTLGAGGTVAEDGSDSADVTVSLGRNLVATETVTVPLDISGTGIMDGDYTIRLKPDTSMVTYNSGVTLSTAAPHSAAEPALVFAGHATNTVQVATLEVTAAHDTTDEGASEALTVGFGTGTRAVSSNLDRASGTGPEGTTTAGTATVTITDDDTAVAAGVTIAETGSPAATVVSEDGTTKTDSYTVVLDTQPTADVAVTVTAGTGVQVNKSGGAAGSSQTLTFTPSTTATLWSTPQTITVTGVDDDVDNAGDARMVTIAHAATSTDAGYTIANAGSVSVTVEDDDTAGVTITESGSPAETVVSEDGTTTTDSYTVVLDSEPLSTVGVSVVLLASGTAELRGPAALATYGQSVTLSFTTGNWDIAQTIRVRGVDDDIDNAADRTQNINHSISTGDTNGKYTAATSISTVTVTVTDDDTAGLVFAPDPVSVGEGATGSYTVKLASRPAAAVTVTITGQAGTDLSVDGPDAGSDSTASETLTFSPTATATLWSTAQTVDLTAAEDTGDADDMVTLAHAVSGAGSGYGTAQNKDLMVTIVDDEGASPVISVALPSGELGVTRNPAGQQVHNEAGGVDGVTFNLSADRELPSTLTVCVRVTEPVGDRLASGDKGIKTVSMTSSSNSNGAGIYEVDWAVDMDDERDSVVKVTVVPPDTAGCSVAAGAYRVSSTAASDTMLIVDDDPTTVELTSSDADMTEGDAMQTATVTVELGRRLHAGEVIAVPITLASATGARLPGSEDTSMTADHDFTVSASGTGVSDENLLTTSPKVIFTGHDTNTVETATVTFTPVTGRDDGDEAHETISATLATDSVLGSTSGTGTTVGGGAMRHGTNYMASLTLTDDEAPTPAVATLGASAYDGYEGDTLEVTVGLDTARNVDTVVTIEQVTGGSRTTSATSGTDFTAGPWTATVAAGDTSATASIALTDDTALEPNETFHVQIQASSLPTGVTAGTTTEAEVTIVDNEYVLGFDETSYSVNEHAGEVELTLTVSKTIRTAIDVYFDYTDGTATSGTDYTEVFGSSSNKTTIPAYERHLTLTVPILPNLASAGTRRFTVTAQPDVIPDGHSANSVTVDITSSGLVITETSGTMVMEDGSDSDTYTIALENAPTHDVTVTVTSGDSDAALVNVGGGTAAASKTLTFSPAGANIWSTAQTVTVTGVDDNIDNDMDQRLVKIAHAASSPDPAYAIDDAGEVEVTVTDDDTAATDTTAPRVTSIVRQTPPTSPTNADSLTWRVTFDEAVANVDAADFQLAGTSASLAVSQVSGTNAWDVTASGGDLAGLDATVTLSFQTTRNIEDTAGNALADTTPTGTNDNSYVVINSPSTGPEVRIYRYGATGSEYAPVTEGTGASFTVSVSSDWTPTGPLTVNLSIAEDESDGQDFVRSGDESYVTVTIDPFRGGLAVLHEVPTVGDETQEPDGAITATVLPGDGYRVGAGASSATVEVLDDDAPRGLILTTSTPTPFTPGDALALAEGGAGGYSVRLANPPTGTVTVTVTEADDTDDDLRVVPTSLTFTTGNWGEPQTVSVWAESDADANEVNEEFTLTHTAAGGGYNGISEDLRVSVHDDDVPDRQKDTLEVSFHPQNDDPVVEVTEGNSGSTITSFYVRTDKPHASALHFRACFRGTATHDSDYRLQQHDGSQWKKASLSAGCLDSTIPANQAHRELRIQTLGDHCPGADREMVDIRISADPGHPLPAPRSIDGTFHVVYLAIDDDDAGKPACGAGLESPSGSDPDTQAIDVQVSAIDDVRARVTWDAVPHATSYQVEWDGQAGDPPVSIASGAWPGVRGTTFTIDHYAAEAMTLTVTVTPEYDDGYGPPRLLDHLAGTATLDVGPGGTQSVDTQTTVPNACVSTELQSDVEGYAAEGYGAAHVARWKKVLKTFAGETGGMTGTEARQMEKTWSASRWEPVAEAIECLEAADQPVVVPEVTVSGGNGVTEGDPASFTITADPAPTAPLTVTLTVGQSGDFAAAGTTGSREVTVPTGGSVTLDIATVDDTVDEPDGSVSITVDPGTGYTVGSANVHTVNVVDDDNAPANAYAALITKMYTWRNDSKWGSYKSHTDRWDRALLAFGESVSDTSLTPMTASEAQAFADRGWTRWVEVAQALNEIESGGTVTPDPVPEVTISGGAGVTEGDSASFTVTANPAPTAPLAVTLTVGQSGDFAAGATGSREITVPTSGSVTLDIATVDDSTAESGGSVSVTIDVGNGYTVGSANAYTVSVADDDTTPASVPELSLAAGSAVNEGGNAEFTITANPAPQADLTVQFTVTQSGEYLSVPPSSRTVTLTAGTTGTTVSLSTVEDSTDEADGSVSMTIDAGTDYTVASAQASGSITVRDNDDPPVVPVVSITAGNGVTEGDPASFTVTANPAPAAPLTITLTVGQSGDYAASGQTGSREVVVPTGGSVTVEVATDDDSADEPDGSITAALDAGSGYTVAVSPDDAASVEVTDNDEAAGVPSLSVVDGEANESEGRLPVVIRLSPPSKNPVSVWVTLRESNPVSAQEGVDYRTWGRFGFKATFRPGETERRFAVAVINDSHDEGKETFEVVLSDPSGGAAISDGVGEMTIVNSDPMPAAWLARFGRTVAEQALDGISGRMAASRTAGTRGSLAGQTLGFGSSSGVSDDNALLPLERNTHGVPGVDPDLWAGEAGSQSRGMTVREALSDSRFTSTGEKDGSGGSLAFWGRGAQSNFDGREGTFSLDGETTTTMLGADYARDNWLVGLALTRSSGKGDYRDNDTGPDCTDTGPLCRGAVQEGNGKVKASLTAAIPYAAIQASERLKLWGALGHGSGEVTLKPEPEPDSNAVAKSYKSDIDWTMMAVGGRSELLPLPREGSGPAVTLTGDALWARTESEKTTSLAASDSDVTRLRLGLEGSWRIATEGDGSITPKLELGVRQDGGDAETGSGMELGAGIAWRDPGLGLSLDLSGRTLITHTDEDLENEGYSVSFQYDPRPASARGLALSLSQEIGGPATGGLDALFAPEPLSERSDSDDDSRLKLEAAYGFPAFSGRYISSPGVSFGRASGSRDYGLGWRFTPVKNASRVSFGVKAVRRESEGASSENAVGVEAALRW